jgi:hypothetical protein
VIQRPVAVSLILCETVIVDEQTKNVTPVNCFRKRRVAGFPSEPFPFIVLAWLTDGMGQGRLEVVIQLLNSDEMDVVHQTSVPCHFTNPRAEVRFTLRIRDCVFPVAGAYDVNLLADGEILAKKRLVIFAEENS